jgi:probable HAF family extracellular repeat protein
MQKPWLESLEERCLLSYQITDLGTLPGGTQSLAYGINNSGQVVGDSTFAGSPFSHAFLWDATNGMQDLGTLPGDSGSRAQGINDFGQVVGISYTDFSAPHAFLWDAVNGMHALGTLPGDSGSSAFGINNSGQVIGKSFIPNTPMIHAFLWDATNGMHALGTLPGDSGSSAFGINNSGQVVGHSFLAGTGVFHAFLWDAVHGMQALGTLPGDSGSTAYGINDSGQVVGKSVGFGTHAFLWDAVHGMQDLGTLTPGGGAYATGINSNTQVIGASEVYCPIVNDYFYEPFVWQNGTMSHLNDLIPPDSGWEPLAVANAINNDGQIVGEAVHIGIGARAYLLTPDSAPGGGASGAARPTAPLFVAANDDRRWSLADPSTVSNGALLDIPLLADRLNARSVDPAFAAGQPDPAWRWARDRSAAPEGPEDRTDAIDRLFTELI